MSQEIEAMRKKAEEAQEEKVQLSEQVSQLKMVKVTLNASLEESRQNFGESESQLKEDIQNLIEKGEKLE